LKILLHSNAAWSPTGYGNQVSVFAPKLRAHHDIAVSAFWGLQGSSLEWNGVRHYPSLGDPYGNDVIQAHAEHWFKGGLRDGLVLSLIDVWVLRTEVWRKLNCASWVPIDHDPITPSIRRFFNESQSIPVAMSKWGRERLQDWDPLYVPHGIDTKALSPQDRKESREYIGLPDDAFVVGMVAANKGVPSRKCFAQSIAAFAEFRKNHPDAILYLHTDAQGRAEGHDLPAMLRGHGVPPSAVQFPNQYLYSCVPFSASHMAALYSSFDVLLNPAMGEGFGIPMLEAQACGTPVITTDFSACREVVAAGWHCEWERFWTYQDSFQALPRVEDIYCALEDSYQRAGDEDLCRAARAHALKYDAGEVVVEHWLPALKEIEKRLADREPIT
jgi:glycosyltransferase involved in cell wall biosynthesis